MKGNAMLVVLTIASVAVHAAVSTDAGVARDDRDYPYTVDLATGVQCGMTGREVDLATAREMASLSRGLPGVGLGWKRVAREMGQYVGFYIYPNGCAVKLYEDTKFVVLLRDGDVRSSDAWFITDNGLTQGHLWDSRKIGRSGLRLKAAWMESTKKGSIIIVAMYPLGSFRLRDVREVGVRRIKVDGKFIDVCPTGALTTSEAERR